MVKAINISNSIIKPGKYMDHKPGNLSNKYMLTPGEAYTVFGIMNTPDKRTYYLVLDDANPEIIDAKQNLPLDPVWYPAELFGDIKGDLDSSWEKTSRKVALFKKATIFSFPELINQRDFLDLVFDGSKKETEIFNQYVKKYQ